MKMLRCILFMGCLLFIPGILQAQSCTTNNIDGTVINIACPQACTNLGFQVPHIKESDEYIVSTIPYIPFPYVTPGGVELTSLYTDDNFSANIPLPFPVCFYGAVYNNVVIGSNGIITFDVSNANLENSWALTTVPHGTIPQPIPYAGGIQNTITSTYYPKASIMGVYHDIFPTFTAGGTRKIEYAVAGSAPCRKFIVSFYNVPMYSSSCNVQLSTSQIVLHESTGFVDVFVGNKPVCSIWNEGLAILGMQNFTRDKAITAPGKNATVWNESGTAYRFMPAGNVSKFVISELLTMSGTLVAVADTSTTTPGLLNLNFNNVCPPPGSTQYRVRTVFSSCSNSATQLISSDIITLNRNNSLDATATSTNTDCGVPNGTITVTIPPGIGIPPYTYVLDAGAPVTAASPYTFVGVGMGPHTIVVTDASGNCTSTVTATVTRNNSLLANTSTTATSCAAVFNGTIRVTATNGTAPFSFQLDGFLPVVGSNPYTFTNVNGGNHNIIVYDATGCQTNVIVVNVPVGAGVNGNTSTTAATCPTVANGSVTVTATTGTAPFTFQLDASAPQTGSSPYTFTNVSAGSHTVSITDFVGCSRSFNITVNAGPSVAATNTTTATTCLGAANGTVRITPSNGVAPYTYSLDGNTPVAGAAPFTFTNIAAGLHNYQVFDAVGCASGIISFMIDPGPGLITTVNKTNVLCNGDATGSIVVNPPPLGNPPFTYSLDGTVWQSSSSFTNLVASTYTVYFRSSNGCQGNMPVTITQPSAITSTTNVIPVVCNGQNNGIISLSPSGGVAPYQYSINNGINWQSNNVFNVAAGSYDIIIKDANNCTINKNVTVTEPAVLSAFSSNSNASCDGGSDGRIIVNASGGNTNYLYSIDGSPFQTSNVFNVNPGSYTIFVKDNLGCANSFTTNVGLTVNLFLNPQADADMCEGTSVQLQTNSNATNYTWTPGLGLNNTTIPSPVANPAITSQYILKAVLGRCTTYDTVMVNVHKAPIPNAGPDGDICYGQSFILQGTGGTQYNWTPAIYLNSITGANPVSTPSRTTVYTLSITDGIGCKSLITDDVKILVKRTMKVNIFPFDTIANPGSQFQLLAVSPGITYNWSPPKGLSSTNIADPIVTVGAIGNDITYEVVAVDDEGCKAEGYVRIKIYKGPDIYVPTGFTPNEDGKNDKFIPVPVGIKSYNYFRVFNRWGQLIFTTTRMNEGWDGTLGGKEQSTGLYVWMIEGVTTDNKLITKKGTITLIR